MVSVSGDAVQRLMSADSGMDSGGRRSGVEQVKRSGARGSGCAHCGERHEDAVPAKTHREARDAVSSEHATEITDPVDDAGGDSACLLAAEVEREGAAEIGIRTQQTE